MKFKKKPVIIEANQWTGKTLSDAERFALETGFPKFSVGSIKGKCGLIIPTLEGDHVAEQYDWIIKGVKGEYYPCKPDIFVQTYDMCES